MLKPKYRERLEKEKGFKERYKLMGLRNGIYTLYDKFEKRDLVISDLELIINALWDKL